MRAAVLALFLAACASPAVPRTDAAGELAALQALEQRVAAVAWRLTSANAEVCPEVGVQTGMTLHDALQYAPAERADAVRFFHLADAPAVIAVAPGGPAERAGLAPGDAITAVNGVSLRSPQSVEGPASYANVARAWRIIEGSLARGPARLSVRRGGEDLALRLEPAAGCAWRVQLAPSTQMTASADGTTVTVSTALVRYAARDDELAVVIGHEMAHNLLSHRARPRGSRRARERAADRAGLYLAARAGYDVSGAADFWRRFGEDDWRARLGVLTHPSPTARSRALAEVAAEIEAVRAAGRPLIPPAD